jgi:hypothetical protein
MVEPSSDQFLPLPFYGWLERPPDLPIDFDEAATAIYIAHGDISAAAALLKVTPARLNRVVRGSPRLVRLKAELQRHRSAVSAGSR